MFGDLITVLLSKIQKEKVFDKCINFFSREKFFNRYFTSLAFGFQSNFQYLLKFISSVEIEKNYFQFLQTMLNSQYFYQDIIPNIGEYHLRKLVNLLLPNALSDYEQLKFDDIILSTENVRDKISIIQIFIETKLTEDKNIEYKKIINENYQNIDNENLLTLIFSNWLNVTSEVENYILELPNKYILPKSKTTFPDHFRNSLENIAILFLNGKLSDIRSLEPYMGKYDVLDFLLKPDIFDYTKVDLTDYTWHNVIPHEKYRKLLLEHKDILLIKIKEHIKADKSCDEEKAFIFRFLATDENCFNISNLLDI